MCRRTFVYIHMHVSQLERETIISFHLLKCPVLNEKMYRETPFLYKWDLAICQHGMYIKWQLISYVRSMGVCGGVTLGG